MKVEPNRVTIQERVAKPAAFCLFYKEIVRSATDEAIQRHDRFLSNGSFATQRVENASAWPQLFSEAARRYSAEREFIQLSPMDQPEFREQLQVKKIHPRTLKMPD